MGLTILIDKRREVVEFVVRALFISKYNLLMTVHYISDRNWPLPLLEG